MPGNLSPVRLLLVTLAGWINCHQQNGSLLQSSVVGSRETGKSLEEVPRSH